LINFKLDEIRNEFKTFNRHKRSSRKFPHKINLDFPRTQTPQLSFVFFSQIISLSGIGSILFGSQLQSFKHEAKRLIIALQMTGGVPASKASFQDITKA